jgi:hypothetical protein
MHIAVQTGANRALGGVTNANSERRKIGREVAMNTNDPNPANKVTVLETNLTKSWL